MSLPWRFKNFGFLLCILIKNSCVYFCIRFKWDTKAFAPDFSICPAEGYICPGMEVSLVVTFAPVEVKQELCYDNLICSIEGGKPVTLTLAGSCIVLPVVSQVKHYLCVIIIGITCLLLFCDLYA